MKGQMLHRYVALVNKRLDCWAVRFPDFAGVEIVGFPLHVALAKAQRDIAERAMILRSLGIDMPQPMSVAEVVATLGYKGSMPLIVAVPAGSGPEKRNVVWSV